MRARVNWYWMGAREREMEILKEVTLPKPRYYRPPETDWLSGERMPLLWQTSCQ